MSRKARLLGTSRKVDAAELPRFAAPKSLFEGADLAQAKPAHVEAQHNLRKAFTPQTRRTHPVAEA